MVQFSGSTSEKRIQTRVGELHLEIPQVRGLRF